MTNSAVSRRSRSTAGAGGLTAGRRWLGLLLGVICLPVLTVVLVGVRGDLTLGSVLLLYLLATVVISVVGGLVAGLIAAVASFALANFFLTPPYHTLAVDDRDSVIELVVFLLVAVTVSGLVDLAARRQAAARELDEVDRLRAALLAAVGHDLRTPLAEIKAAVTTLQLPDVQLTADDRSELLASIEHSTDWLSDLIANLLDLSRLQAGALSMDQQPVALDEVVARALIDRRFADVANEVADDLPMAYADAGLLERVIANLLDNAHRHTLGRAAGRGERPGRPDPAAAGRDRPRTRRPRGGLGPDLRAVPAAGRPEHRHQRRPRTGDRARLHRRDGRVAGARSHARWRPDDDGHAAASRRLGGPGMRRP